MARSQAQQLPLPCTVDEAVQLKEEVTSLRYEVQWRGARIRDLEEQLDATKAQLAAAQAVIRDLTVRNTALETVLRLHPTPSLPAESIPRTTLDRALQCLAAEVHPDHWQGSPIAEELVKRVLALRVSVQEGRL